MLYSCHVQGLGVTYSCLNKMLFVPFSLKPHPLWQLSRIWYNLGQLRLVNHRSVLYDITHQRWNPGLNKVNKSFAIDFSGVMVSSRTFSHILSYTRDTRVLWFSTEWTNYLRPTGERKKIKIKRLWSGWQGQGLLRSCHLHGMELQSRF